MTITIQDRILEAKPLVVYGVAAEEETGYTCQRTREGLPDGVPVSERHTFVIPPRHMCSLWDLTAGELHDIAEPELHSLGFWYQESRSRLVTDAHPLAAVSPRVTFIATGRLNPLQRDSFERFDGRPQDYPRSRCGNS